MSEQKTCRTCWWFLFSCIENPRKNTDDYACRFNPKKQKKTGRLVYDRKKTPETVACENYQPDLTVL